jgi:hypothetical protein
MIILPPPRISNAGGFLDSDAIDVEHMQQRRFVSIYIGADFTKGFLVQMERYLEGGVVTPEADAVLRRIVISTWVRKMRVMSVPMILPSRAAAGDVSVGLVGDPSSARHQGLAEP